MVALLGLALVATVSVIAVSSEPKAVLWLAGLALVLLAPVFVPLGFGSWGRKHGWSPQRIRYASIAFVALWLIGLAGLLGRGIHKVGESSKLKAMLPRQMAAAVDQFYLEYNFRIFASYKDLVGPRQYIKAYNAVDGEDLGIQFPIRRDWSIPLPVRLPDGTTVQRYEVLAAVGRSGLIAYYPWPQEDIKAGSYSRDRVYRLDCGISYRGYEVVDLPPDPAGREGRDQDGVHVYRLADGRRFEITYRGGVPDGPFRAFFPDGRPWGEATYEKGRLVGPSWLILRDGRKIDELADGEAAEAAMVADLEAATKDTKALAREKLQAGDAQGALVALDRALAINPVDPAATRLRGDAYRKLGNLDRAIADYCAADGYPAELAAQNKIPPHIEELFFARWQQRTAQGDAAGAAADARVLINTAVWNAEAQLDDRQPGSAAKSLARALTVGPLAEVHALQARVHWMQDRLVEAEASYTQAIEFAETGRMQIPANQRLLPARYRYQRGHVRRWLGKSEEAAADFQAAYPVLGNSAEVRQGHAALWRFIATVEAGRKDQATADLAATDRAAWWPHERELADLLLGRASEEQTAALIARSNQDDDRLLGSLFTGILHERAGDITGALEHYRKAARLSGHDLMAREAARRAYHPFSPDPIPPSRKPSVQPGGAPPRPAATPEQARLAAAYQKAQHRDYAGAEAEVTALIDSGTPKFGYFLRRARFRFFQGNFDGAIEDYGRAEPLAPSLSQAAFERGHVLRAKHDLEGAAREFRAVLAKDAKRFNPTSGRVALWLYATECARGQGDAARQELDGHIQRLAAFKKSDIQQAIANLDAELAGLLSGRTGEAQAEAAVNAGPANARAEFRFRFLFFSALARRLAGDEAGARELFQRARAAYPNIEGLDYERAEAEQALAAAP